MKFVLPVRVLAAAAGAAVLLSGCAGVSQMAGALGASLSGSGGIAVKAEHRPDGAAVGRQGQAIRLQMADLVDARPGGAGTRIGAIRATVSDMHASELTLEQSISATATQAIRTQLATDGFQVLTSQQGADFEVTGKVRSFELQIAGSDELHLALELQLRDLTSGEIVWSGIVTEKSERFAGVMGNSRASITRYLNEGLVKWSQMASAAIRASLLQAYPQSIATAHLPGGTSPTLPGVTTLKAATPREAAGQVVRSPSGALPPAQPALPQADLSPQAYPRGSWGVPIAATPKPASPAARGPLAAPGYGYFSVITMPTRVKVYADDVYYGLTPLKVMVPTGVTTFEFRFDGYTTVREKVLIRKDETTELELKLSKP